MPQANAATKEIHQQIMDALNGVNTKVTAIQSDTQNIRQQLNNSSSLQIQIVTKSVEYFIPTGETGTDSSSLFGGSVLTIPNNMEGTLDYFQCDSLSSVPRTQSTHYFRLQHAGQFTGLGCNSNVSIELQGGDSLVFNCKLRDPAASDTRCIDEVTIWMKLKSTGTS